MGTPFPSRVRILVTSGIGTPPTSRSNGGMRNGSGSSGRSSEEESVEDPTSQCIVRSDHSPVSLPMFISVS